ncbi:MAG: SRPBCC domain-containing protein [Planctomycetota bacterium]
MRTPDGRYTGVVGEILRCEPPRVLEHTFRFTNFDDPPCVVRYEIEPKGDGVLFTMTLLDMPPGSKTAKQMMSGGKLICGVLKSVIETGRPALGGRMILAMIGLMRPLTPKRCRSEHWPVRAAEGVEA